MQAAEVLHCAESHGCSQGRFKLSNCGVSFGSEAWKLEGQKMGTATDSFVIIHDRVRVHSSLDSTPLLHSWMLALHLYITY
jgi:hypothetical protein